jgi:AcrR family transcriptional regulator
MSNKTAPAPRRTRRSPDERLEEIRLAATEAFALRPFEEVSLEQVAQQVGVSKALVYHYFPGKSALLAAVIENGSILAATAPDESLPPHERGRASLEAYFAYALAHRLMYLSMFRHGALAEASIRTRIEMNQATQRRRIMGTLRAMGASGVDEARLDPVLEAWQAFLVNRTLRWLETEVATDPAAPPPRELCGAVYVAALEAAGVTFRRRG